MPATLLIGPDGKALARGVHGPAALEAVKGALGEFEEEESTGCSVSGVWA